MIKTRKKQLLLTLFVSVSLISLVFGTQGAYAALKMETPTVKNSFEPMENVKPTINETFDKNNDDVLEKKDVTVTNNNEFDVYVRAKVVVSWQDANGNTLAVTPLEGTDYTAEYGTDWTKKADGYYYYNSILPKGGTTTNLLTDCKQTKKAPRDGYTLSVNIITQTEQTINDDGEGELPFEPVSTS